MTVSTDLTTFQFNGQNPLRIVLDENNDPLFAAADACAVLGLTNVSQALSRLYDDEKREIISNDVTGRLQSISFVTEPGLYRLIFRSVKPEAKRFQDWVFNDVLPTLRKTGSYFVKPLTALDQLAATVEILKAQEAQLANHSTRIERLEAENDTRFSTYFSIKGWAAYKHLRAPSNNEAIRLGRAASKLSRQQGVPYDEIEHPDHGWVHRYAPAILEQTFKAWK